MTNFNIQYESETIPHGAIAQDGTFTSDADCVALLYWDESLLLIDGINPIVKNAKHDALSDLLFYRDFLTYIATDISSGRVYTVSDGGYADPRGFYYCTRETLADDALWSAWLASYQGR
jgi:hypothetical protein